MSQDPAIQKVNARLGSPIHEPGPLLSQVPDLPKVSGQPELSRFEVEALEALGMQGEGRHLPFLSHRNTSTPPEVHPPSSTS